MYSSTFKYIHHHSVKTRPHSGRQKFRNRRIQMHTIFAFTIIHTCQHSTTFAHAHSNAFSCIQYELHSGSTSYNTHSEAARLLIDLHSTRPHTERITYAHVHIQSHSVCIRVYSFATAFSCIQAELTSPSGLRRIHGSTYSATFAMNSRPIAFVTCRIRTNTPRAAYAA